MLLLYNLKYLVLLTMKNIIVIVCVFIAFICGVLVRNCFCKDIQNGSSFLKINDRFDKEHNDILNAFDNLYDKCEKHWKTENEYFKKGLKKLPKNHEDVIKKWKPHEQEHINLLETIKKAKNDVINHIQDKDGPDFHWTIDN